MISGTPMHLKVAQHIAQHGDRHGRMVQRMTANSVLQKMRDRADHTPAWEGMSDGITMTQREDGAYEYSFDPEHPRAAEAYKLEFGTPDIQPHSIFRAVLADRSGIEREMRAELRLR